MKRQYKKLYNASFVQITGFEDVPLSSNYKLGTLSLESKLTIHCVNNRPCKSCGMLFQIYSMTLSYLNQFIGVQNDSPFEPGEVFDD
jgi:hypothetical protein